jgi:hypothetical protein
MSCVGLMEFLLCDGWLPSDGKLSLQRRRVLRSYGYSLSVWLAVERRDLEGGGKRKQRVPGLRRWHLLFDARRRLLLHFEIYVLGAGRLANRTLHRQRRLERTRVRYRLDADLLMLRGRRRGRRYRCGCHDVRPDARMHVRQ